MNGKERYIHTVLDGIFASRDERDRLEADLESHFAEGQEAGESEADIMRRLGSPDEVVASFMQNVNLEYAGFWIRTFAFVTDFAICCLVTLPILCAVAAVASIGVENEEPPLFVFFLLAPVIMWCLATFLFYFPALESHFGKTLGKHLMGLRVLNEDGTRLGLGKAFLRRLSFYFEFLALDALFAPFTEKKQRALDILAKTVVVREKTEISVGSVLLCLVIIASPLCAVLGVAIATGLC